MCYHACYTATMPATCATALLLLLCVLLAAPADTNNVFWRMEREELPRALLSKQVEMVSPTRILGDEKKTLEIRHIQTVQLSRGERVRQAAARVVRRPLILPTAQSVH
eukprot:GHVS01085242.1.p1 GENE.GHVS01085242.1~~GHVS01085242.1.p1  ORF type:complete len:108 (+),score=10.70 GHVS01085242.1:28-351(+)